MNSRHSSFASITELFRPIRPKGLGSRNLSDTRLHALKKEIQTNLHLIPIGELLAKLQTDGERGLSAAAAAERLRYYGTNTLTPASETSWLKVLLRSMFTGELLAKLQTDGERGLSAAAAAERLRYYGTNTLTPAFETSWLKVLLRSMFTGTNHYFVEHVRVAGELLAKLQTEGERGLSAAAAAERLRYYGTNTLTPAFETSWLKVLLRSMFTGTNHYFVEHVRVAGELLAKLQTEGERGLSAAAAAERLRYYGTNTLTPAFETSWLKVLLRSMFTGTNHYFVEHVRVAGELLAKLQTEGERGLSAAAAAERLRYYGTNTLTPAFETSWLKVLLRSMFTGTNHYFVEHVRVAGELLAKLQTEGERGLSAAAAAERLRYYGTNTLTPASETSWLKVLLRSMFTGFSLLIWLGAVLCLTAFSIELGMKAVPSYDNLYLACVLICVDLICGFFSFLQNYKSSRIMKTFKDLIPSYARCTRDGRQLDALLVQDLVKGDVVLVRAGDVVPADIRILDSKGFKVDNSSLTGESVAVARGSGGGTDNILDSPNVAFFSTLCIEGWARGVVLCTGDATALGRVAGLAARLAAPPSPLQRALRRFMRLMAAWAVALGVLIAVLCFALGYPFMQISIFVIGIVVANIPEGLAPTVTAALALAAQRLAARSCVVRRLAAVESLGAVSTLCCDKTGTLTRNQMCVRHVWLPAADAGDIYAVEDDDFDARTKDKSEFAGMKLCGVLCSTAQLAAGQVQGDASETAILTFLHKYGDPDEIRRQYPKVAEVPFNSTNKYQVSVHAGVPGGRHVVLLKGAPEEVAARSLLSTAQRAALQAATDALAETGERVLAFAELYLDVKKFPPGFAFETENVNFPLEGLRLLGLMGLKDPPRDEVAGAVVRLRAAGVRVVMVTGDHPGTARAVAREAGLVTSAAARVLTGAELRAMTPDLLARTLLKHHEIVFARTSPMQKLQVVEAFQRLHEDAVVAVTGDGVNDAPALRQAHIGIAMGRTGSQVSKQTADIVLLDDNFTTIVLGIEEGRKIFDNLKKSVCYILISNVPEIAPVLMFIIFAIPLPLGVMTILCVDLGTDMWPAVALSFERAESDVMSGGAGGGAGCGGPRAGALVSRRMLWLAYMHLGLMEFAAGMFAYFVVMAEHGFMPQDLLGIRRRWDSEAVSDVRDSRGGEWDYAPRKRVEAASQAAYFVAIVLMQLTNALVCKTRYNSLWQVGMKNRWLNYGLVFEVAVACFICYTPGVNDFFRTYPLKLRWWFLALPFAALMLAFDEFRKYCIRNNMFNSFYNNLTYY